MFTGNSTFIFESFDFDAGKKIAHFLYRIEEEGKESVHFTETVQFDTPGGQVNTTAFQRVLFDMHLALGMSYWKTACSQRLYVRSGRLSKADAEFWNTVYTKGLGEFFYQNRIDFHGLVQFPSSTDEVIAPKLESVDLLVNTASVLVPLGGGKDSLTTIGILQRAEMAFETVSLGVYPLIEEQVKKIGMPHHRVLRTIDPQLFELNRTGAYNGHVPISVIYALSSIAVAVLNGHSSVVLSNERSANYGNVQYLGEEINHQWSKSLEFESLLQEHLSLHAIPVIYCSLLRPLYEFQITKLFIQDCEKWSGLFSSCNRNFTQTSSISTTSAAYWCGVCPKCVFVGTLLASHMSKEDLTTIIGSNPLENEVNEEVFLELLGISAFKPFECVGTPNEMIIALEKIIVQPEYADAVLVQLYNTVHSQLDVETALQDVHAFGDAIYIPQQFSTAIEIMKQSII